MCVDTLHEYLQVLSDSSSTDSRNTHMPLAVTHAALQAALRRLSSQPVVYVPDVEIVDLPLRLGARAAGLCKLMRTLVP